MSSNTITLDKPGSEVIKLEALKLECVGVMIVDHRRMVRASLESFIAEQPDLEVIAQAVDHASALEALKECPTENMVVIVELDSTDGAGLALVRTIAQDFPGCVVVGFGRGEDGPAVARAFYAGVSAFVDANVDPSEIIDAIRSAANGEIVVKGIPRQLLPRLAQEIEKLKSGGPKLTDRECQILQVAAEGLAAQEIARQIGISVRTVTTHLSHIYSKLGVHSRVAAIAVATKAGYLSSQAVSA